MRNFGSQHLPFFSLRTHSVFTLCSLLAEEHIRSNSRSPRCVRGSETQSLFAQRLKARMRRSVLNLAKGPHRLSGPIHVYMGLFLLITIRFVSVHNLR
jgi:hypothetical protein